MVINFFCSVFLKKSSCKNAYSVEMRLIEIYLLFPSGLERKITEHKSISQKNIMLISTEVIIYGYDTVYHTFCLKIP